MVYMCYQIIHHVVILAWVLVLVLVLFYVDIFSTHIYVIIIIDHALSLFLIYYVVNQSHRPSKFFLEHVCNLYNLLQRLHKD